MTDDNSQSVSKADLEALLETITLKAQARETELKATFQKELDIQANKIHSSYAKKLKKLGISEDDSDESTERKPTNKELELTKTVESLVAKMGQAEKLARLSTFRAGFTEQLVKHGISPEAVDQVFTVLNAKQAIEDQGDLGFRLKVDVDGTPVALPIEQAIKHYVKSQEAKFYLAPTGAKGSGAKVSTGATTETPNDGKAKNPFGMEVDWKAIGQALANGQ